MPNEIRLLGLAFKSDAAHNLMIANAAKHHTIYSREPMRAKILVILHMAIECALKCIIATERPDKELPHIYKIIKKNGHDLNKLLSAIIEPAINESLRDRIKIFNPPGVHIRYGFEVMMLMADAIFSPGRSPEFSDQMMDEAFDLATHMVELATGIHDTAYRSTSFTWENGETPEIVVERIKKASSKYN